MVAEGVLSAYRVCSRCIMDTCDPDIVFDESGMCSHWRQCDDVVAHDPNTDLLVRQRNLQKWVDRIR